MKGFLTVLACITIMSCAAVWEFDPALRQQRADWTIQLAQREQAETEQSVLNTKLDMNRRQALAQTMIVFEQGLLILVFLFAVAGGLILLDQYAMRREPLISVRSDGTIALPRRSLVQGDYDVLAVQLAIMSQNIRMTQAQHPQLPEHLDYAPHYTRSSEMSDADQPSEDLEVIKLPTAPSWAEISQTFTATANKMLMGYSLEGAVYAPITGLLSTALIGRPGQGKSNALRMIYAQTVTIGGKIGLIDPHGSVIGDIGNPPGLLFSAGSANEMADATAWLLETLTGRLQDYRDGRREFVPNLVLADELPVIALTSEAMIKALGRVICEGRKIGMYALTASQGALASQWGNTMLRDALSSRLVFKCSIRQARYAGLDKEALPLVLGLDVGRCVLAGPVDPTVVAIPRCETKDVAGLLSGAEDAELEPEVVQPAEREPAPEPIRIDTFQGLTNEEHEVMNMLKEGKSPSRITHDYFNCHGGPKFTENVRRVRAIREKMFA